MAEVPSRGLAAGTKATRAKEISFKEIVSKKKNIYDWLHKKSEGNKIFYEEYHVTEADVISGLCENEEIRELIYQK